MVRWPRRNGTNGETIIANIDCKGLIMDENTSLYVVDYRKVEVRYDMDEENLKEQLLQVAMEVEIVSINSVVHTTCSSIKIIQYIVVADGEGAGNSLTPLSSPRGVLVDQLGTVYVTDGGNDQIMRWPNGATQRGVIVGENG
ncbi:unnamed protein product [Rotaria socialis]|uniref:NHL repeat-containing protein n=1 Tax=Rotaria socialis TaxID=392032 RepID=A0A819YXW0_9BILA|nr:unnamed protein product [Rotaria socialis]